MQYLEVPSQLGDTPDFALCWNDQAPGYTLLRYRHQTQAEPRYEYQYRSDSQASRQPSLLGTFIRAIITGLFGPVVLDLTQEQPPPRPRHQLPIS